MSWKLSINRIWRGKWLVLAFGIAAAIVATAACHSHPDSYTAWAILTTGAPNRAPEQDGVLSAGYVDFFNTPGYQNKLGGSAKLPGDVTLVATTAAASPIIYVKATSASREDATAAASTASKVFQTDINRQLRAAQDDTIAAMRKPFDDALQANGIASQASLENLQDSINQINSDTSNKLIDLNPESGVSKGSTPTWPIVLLAFLAGCLVGCAVAIVKAALSRRLTASDELAAKVGMAPIVDIPSSGSERARRLRTLRVQQLVNAVGLASPACSSVTVTSTVASGRSLHVARALAQGRAAQGVRTVLINADVHVADGVGFGDIIADQSVDVDSVIVATDNADLMEIKAGSSSANPFAAITSPRLMAIISRLKRRADFVVIAAPPVSEAAETQVLCAATDGVLLVVDSSVSRVRDTVESVNLLEAAGVRVVGTVLVHGSDADESDAGDDLGLARHRAVNGTEVVDSSDAMGEVEWQWVHQQS
jgi:Mrp family chromosome partitioning ATPase